MPIWTIEITIQDIEPKTHIASGNEMGEGYRRTQDKMEKFGKGWAN